MQGRHDLTGAEWAIISPLPPDKPRGVPRVDDRRVISWIFHILRTGTPWRDLPERCGPHAHATVCNRWAKQGVWERLFEALAARSPGSLHLLDASVVRAHRHAAGGKRGSGPRHRTLARRAEHQNPRRRRPWLLPPHPDPTGSPGAALGARSPVPPTQPRRTLLQQAQALPRHRDPRSQARKKLARRNRPCLHPPPDQNQ